MTAAPDHTTRRTAVVTGGGGGIGGAICGRLGRAGYAVYVADLSASAAEVVAARVGGVPLEVDVVSTSSVTSAVSRVLQETGSIDVLINAVGWDEHRPIVESDDKFIAHVLEINLAGPIRMTREVLPSMMRAGYGRIVNIASDAGRVGSSLESVYSAAKAGIIAFTKTAAREAARSGVTANCVCPGPTDTALLSGIIAKSPDAEKVISAITRSTPLKRLGMPEDVAVAVLMFAGEDAGFITGQTLSVSGGLTMV
jgi:2-hydroxycyclohexanecarboxyl-CoA dehydrogenase